MTLAFSKYSFSASLLFAVVLVSGGAEAQQRSPAPEVTPYDDQLLGTMGGLRPYLAEYGATLSVEYDADFWDVASGGLKTGTNYLDNAKMVLDVDGAKAYHLEGNKLHFYLLNNAGSAPNGSRIGSVEGIDNVEVTTNTFKLYELWTEQSFLDKKAALLVGLYDLNTEFYTTDMSATFLKPTMGIGQELAQTGTNGPSIFPNTSLGARLKVLPSDNTYLQVAALEAVSGDPAHPRGTHVRVNPHDGLLLVAEGGYVPGATDDGAFNKLAFGAWRYTKEVDDILEVDANGKPLKRDSQGVYGLSSYRFYEDKEAGKSLGAFLRAGLADGDTAQVQWSYEAGLVANGWVPGRADGEFGLGVSQSHDSGKYIDSVKLAGGDSEPNEIGFELYYKDTIYRGVTVQPDIQYIVNPGTTPDVDNALAIGLRIGVQF